MDEEFYCEWQALSMEDAIWNRKQEKCWWRVPEQQAVAITNTIEEDDYDIPY